MGSRVEYGCLHESLKDVCDQQGSGFLPSTSTSAAILGLNELGMVAAGKSADFIVLNANPLDDIHNTRQIDSVYLRGDAVDRNRMRAR